MRYFISYNLHEGADALEMLASDWTDEAMDADGVDITAELDCDEAIKSDFVNSSTNFLTFWEFVIIYLVQRFKCI